MTALAGAAHVDAQDDVIAHDTDGDACICGPTVAPRRCSDGSLGWHVTHNRLDAPERPGRNAHA